MKVDRDQQDEHRGEGCRPGQESDRQEDAGEKLGERKQRRPEDAGIEAEALDHLDRAERVGHLAEAMRYESEAGNDAKQRLGVVMQGGVDALQAGNDQACAFRYRR